MRKFPFYKDKRFNIKKQEIDCEFPTVKKKYG